MPGGHSLVKPEEDARNKKKDEKYEQSRTEVGPEAREVVLGLACKYGQNDDDEHGHADRKENCPLPSHAAVWLYDALNGAVKFSHETVAGVRCGNAAERKALEHAECQEQDYVRGKPFHEVPRAAHKCDEDTEGSRD